MCNAHHSFNTGLNAATIPSIPPENMLSSSPKAQRLSPSTTKRRSVTFHETVKVFAHIHIRDMPQNIISRTWYSPNDLLSIKQEVCQVANNTSADDSFAACPRGLEFRTITGAIRRRRNKERAWDAVMNEQDRQWDQNIIDEEAIAEVYRACSSRTAMEAHEAALEDAEEALREYWSLKAMKTARCPTVERRTKSPLRHSQISSCNRAA